MEKIVWIGSPFFSGALEQCGWPHVRALNFEEPRVWSWRQLVDAAGFEPDVLVVADKSRAPFVLGMENFPCLTVFYAVDSHIHSWQPMYAQGFDACLVSLRDHLADFAGPFLPADRVWWSPPFAKTDDQPAWETDKTWDALFVGSCDQRLMPRRHRFLAELGSLVPGLKVVYGDYRSLFPRARVVVNQAENHDLNFRVFEAMGCGSCLVTPRVGHGLDKLFVDGEHMVGYRPDDAADAAYRVNFLLEHPDVREHIGKTATEEINARHRALHRAQAFTDHLCDLAMQGVEEIVGKRLENAQAIRKDCLAVPYLLWADELPQSFMKEACLAAARGEFGLDGIA